MAARTVEGLNGDAMNTERAGKDDRLLDELLRAWKVDEALPPSFQEQVWRRISLEESKQAPGVSAWLAGVAAAITSILRQPLGATAYLSILLLAGVAAGYWTSEQEVRQTEATWRTAYVRTVVPTTSLSPAP